MLILSTRFDVPSVQIRDFEDVLKHVGGWGRYQLTLLVVSFPFTLFLAYVAYSPILFMYTPEHWCAPDPKWGFGDSVMARNESLREAMLDAYVPREDEGGARSRCYMYDLDDFVGKTDFDIFPADLAMKYVNRTTAWLST